MEQYLIPAGLILNSALILLNRYWKRIPNWLYLSGLILGICLIIAGAIIIKRAGGQ